MKLSRGDIVYIDANAIAAAHSAHAWNALRQGFKLVTARVCVEEATRPNKYRATLTDKSLEELSAELEVRTVDEETHLGLRSALGRAVALDAGEWDLVALARRERVACWHLCGPDRATLRALHHMGMVQRMVALEEMLLRVGAPVAGLPDGMTVRWLTEKRTKLALGDSLL